MDAFAGAHALEGNLVLHDMIGFIPRLLMTCYLFGLGFSVVLWGLQSSASYREKLRHLIGDCPWPHWAEQNLVRYWRQCCWCHWHAYDEGDLWTNVVRGVHSHIWCHWHAYDEGDLWSNVVRGIHSHIWCHRLHNRNVGGQKCVTPEGGMKFLRIQKTLQKHDA